MHFLIVPGSSAWMAHLLLTPSKTLNWLLPLPLALMAMSLHSGCQTRFVQRMQFPHEVFLRPGELEPTAIAPAA